MKITLMIARLLLGLVFVVFGLNGFLHFIPMQPMPAGFATQFVSALAGSGYFYVVSFCQVVGGALLLANRYVPFALTMLGPVLVNILTFHIFMAPAGLPLAFVAVILWALVFWQYRVNFAGIFAQNRVI